MPFRSRHHRVLVERPFAGTGVSIYVAPTGQIKYRTSEIQSRALRLVDGPTSKVPRVASVTAAVSAAVDTVVPIDDDWDDADVDIDVRPYANGFERVAILPITKHISDGDTTSAVVLSATLARNETRKGGKVIVAIRPSISPAGITVVWTLEVDGQTDVVGTAEQGRIVFRASYPEGNHTGTIAGTVDSVRHQVMTGIAIVSDATGPTLSNVTGSAK